jgi:hypothetical protein
LLNVANEPFMLSVVVPKKVDEKLSEFQLELFSKMVQVLKQELVNFI